MAVFAFDVASRMKIWITIVTIATGLLVATGRENGWASVLIFAMLLLASPLPPYLCNQIQAGFAWMVRRKKTKADETRDILSSSKPQACESCGESSPVSDTICEREATVFCCETHCFLGFKTCLKNPGHGEFHPIRSFSEKKLPLCIRHTAVADCIKAIADLTVRLVVKSTSEARPETDEFVTFAGSRARRGGSGTVNFVLLDTSDTTAWFCGPCHHYDDNDDDEDPKRKSRRCLDCKLCHMDPCPWTKTKGARHPAHSAFTVETACHVVYDDTEVTSTDVDLFFEDSRDKDGVVTVPGGRWIRGDLVTDWSKFLCATDNAEVIGRLLSVEAKVRSALADVPWYVKAFLVNNYQVLVSHPHGQPKMVSVGVGRRGHNTFSDDGRWLCYRFPYTTPSCPGSSGAATWWWGTFGFNHFVHRGSNAGTGLNESSNSGWSMFQLRQSLIT